MRNTKRLAFVIALSSALSLQNAYAQNATFAAEVSADQIAAVSEACVGGAETELCKSALEALIAALKAANPGVSIAALIGSIAVAFSQASNASLASTAVGFNAAAAAQALTALASYAHSVGLSNLAETIVAIATNVESRVSIDLTAIAEGAGIAIPADLASPA